MQGRPRLVPCREVAGEHLGNRSGRGLTTRVQSRVVPVGTREPRVDRGHCQEKNRISGRNGSDFFFKVRQRRPQYSGYTPSSSFPCAASAYMSHIAIQPIIE